LLVYPVSAEEQGSPTSGSQDTSDPLNVSILPKFILDHILLSKIFSYNRGKVVPLPYEILHHEGTLCLIKRHAMKTYGGNGGIVPRILNLGTRWK
jgi:hypothetical protein